MGDIWDDVREGGAGEGGVVREGGAGEGWGCEGGWCR